MNDDDMIHSEAMALVAQHGRGAVKAAQSAAAASRQKGDDAAAEVYAQVAEAIVRHRKAQLLLQRRAQYRARARR